MEAFWKSIDLRGHFNLIKVTLERSSSEFSENFHLSGETLFEQLDEKNIPLEGVNSKVPI